jgi:hypothetical protein
MHKDRKLKALQCPSFASIVSVQSLIDCCLVYSIIQLLFFLILLHLDLDLESANQSKVQNQKDQYLFYLHFLSL